MIKLNANERTVRETQANFEYRDESGELKTEKIRVLYYSPTIAESKAERAEMKRIMESDTDEIYWLSDSLSRRLQALPDIVDADEKPYEITKEFLESIDFKNLEAIKAAIDEDLRPKGQGTK